MSNARSHSNSDSPPTVKHEMGATPAPRPAPLLVPRVPVPESIGGYHIVCSLGAGGMAQVYLCQARGIGGFDKLLVVKAPRDEVLSDVDTVEMFLNEARIAGRLNHPNVVQTNEVGMCDGVPFMAMEYLEGRSLSEIQRQIGLKNLSTDFQLRVIANALAGLHYAHELSDYSGAPLNIVHRDVSPQNVFVTYDGVTKLLDFGIAKAAGTTNLTREGVLKGKLAYMAPEQGALEAIDRRADIFAMGVMIWEAVTHQRLVPLGSHELSVHRRRVLGEDPGVRDVAPDAPADLVDICARAMAREPDDRYQTALELKDALETYLMNSSRPSDAAVGRFVSEAFAEGRVAVRAQIDERLAGRSSFPPPRAQSAHSGTFEASNQGTTVDASGTPPAAVTKSSTRGLRSVLGGMLVLATAGAITTLVVNRRRDEANTRPAASVNDVPPRQSLPMTTQENDPNLEATRKVRISFHVTPPTSELVIDGERVAGDTFDEDVTASAEAHRIRASAPGCAPQERVLAFDRDLHVNIALVPSAAPAPRRGGVVSTPTTPALTTARQPPAPQPLRPIDDKDPYR